MEVLYPRCAGLDVHQQTVVACARIASGSTVQQEVRTFGTATGDLLALADWLTAHGCSHVAIAYTSHCTSLGRFETFSVVPRLFKNKTQLPFFGGCEAGNS